MEMARNINANNTKYISTFLQSQQRLTLSISISLFGRKMIDNVTFFLVNASSGNMKMREKYLQFRGLDRNL